MYHSLRTRALAALALAASLGACATGGAGRDTFLSETPPRPDRVCRAASHPERLPEAAELVAPEFAAEAARVWEAAGRPAGAYALFSMRYDREGLNVRRAVLEHNLGGQAAETLQKLVFENRLETGPSREEWGVRMRVDLGPRPALRVGRQEECGPAPRESEYRRAASGFDVRDSFSSLPGASRADLDLVWVRVRLDASGLVTDARLERTFSRGVWESRVLSLARNIQFHPAVEDGYPVPSETSIPLRLSSLR